MVNFINVISAHYIETTSFIDCIIKVSTNGNTEEEWPFTYNPSDTAPVTLAVKQWFIDHPEFVPEPYVRIAI